LARARARARVRVRVRFSREGVEETYLSFLDEIGKLTNL
jgi:hypothetical protein